MHVCVDEYLSLRVLEVRAEIDERTRDFPWEDNAESYIQYVHLIFLLLPQSRPITLAAHWGMT